MPEKRLYVAGDLRGIQDFIFASTHLFEARGASALVDFFDRCAVPHLVKAAGGDRVFSGGGNFLASFPESADVDSFMEAARLALLDLMGDPYGILLARTEHPSDFQSGREEVDGSLRGQKRNSPAIVPATGLPFWKRCQSCARVPAEIQVEVGQTQPEDREDNNWVCLGCRRKREIFRLIRKAQEDGRPASQTFACLFHNGRCKKDVKPFSAELRGFKFERDLASVAAEEGEVGFVLADGNGMGSWFGKIKEEDPYRSLSATVDSELRRALSVACHATFPREEGLLPLLPLQVLICGGDDLLVVAPASHALGLARAFLKEFVVEYGAQKKSASVGVLICKPTFPFQQAHKLAESLLSHAKAYCYELAQRGESDGPRALDFHRVTASMVQSLEEERAAIRGEAANNEWSYGAAGPYSLGELEGVEKMAETLRRNVTRAQRGVLREILSPGDHGPGTPLEKGVPKLVLDRLDIWLSRQRRPADEEEARKFDDLRKWIELRRFLDSWKVKRGERVIDHTAFKLADALALADLSGS